MRYYKQLNENEKLIAIGTGLGGEEITKEEYDTLLAEIRQKADLVDKLYSEEITIEDVTTEWQEEIQRRVNERKEQEVLAAENAEATDEDFINALAELGVTVDE